jgi:hypothetical protein
MFTLAFDFIKHTVGPMNQNLIQADLVRLFEPTQLLPLPIINPLSNDLSVTLRDLDLILNAINLIDSEIGLITDLNSGRSFALGAAANEPFSRRDWL